MHTEKRGESVRDSEQHAVDRLFDGAADPAPKPAPTPDDDPKEHEDA